MRMNDDLMRLSDLVPEYARYYELKLIEAAFGLHELLDETLLVYLANNEKPSIEDLFWAGRINSPQRSTKGYVVDEEALLKHLKNLCEPQTGIDSSFINCFCHYEYTHKNIPTNIVYFSRTALSELIIKAGLEAPGFLLSDYTIEYQDTSVKRSSQAKRENSLKKIINGLFEIIKEVDKAHTEPTLDDKSKKRAETIKRRALELHAPREKCAAILRIADAAGVDMPKSAKTLQQYIDDDTD